MGVVPQDGKGKGEEGTKKWGCTKGGMGEGGKSGRERAATEETRPKRQGKTPRGAVQVLLEARTRSCTAGVLLDTTASAPLGVQHAGRAPVT